MFVIIFIIEFCIVWHINLIFAKYLSLILKCYVYAGSGWDCDCWNSGHPKIVFIADLIKHFILKLLLNDINIVSDRINVNC